MKHLIFIMRKQKHIQMKFITRSISHVHIRTHITDTYIIVSKWRRCAEEQESVGFEAKRLLFANDSQQQIGEQGWHQRVPSSPAHLLYTHTHIFFFISLSFKTFFPYQLAGLEISQFVTLNTPVSFLISSSNHLVLRD